MLGKVVFWTAQGGLTAALASPAQDAQKIKSVNIPARMREGHQVPPLPEELLAVKGCWGRESNSSSGTCVATGKLPMIQ